MEWNGTRIYETMPLAGDCVFFLFTLVIFTSYAKQRSTYWSVIVVCSKEITTPLLTQQQSLAYIYKHLHIIFMIHTH